MGRNAPDALGQQITGRRMADVTQTDDADHPLALVDHRQPAELQLLHVMHRLCEVIVLPATMDAFGHHISRHRAASIEVVARKPFADDIAVGHHPDQSVVLPNRNAADVMLPISFASSVTGVLELTQSTPLCITSLTFMADLRCWFSGALDAMQHSPYFPNYTTDRVRRHRRLKKKASFLRDRTRQMPPASLPPSLTIDSDFAAGVPARHRKGDGPRPSDAMPRPSTSSFTKA